MNKFSDGFSDNSYEDLLNEYAGESLGSKSPRRTENKETPPKRETLPRVVKPASPPAQRRKPEPAPPK